MHGLQKAVTMEAGIPAAFVAWLTSTLAITLGKSLTSLSSPAFRLTPFFAFPIFFFFSLPGPKALP
ncbi:MAG: hypothetical protein JXR77_14225, partial [Lentisphaeria bacterium]|nr:hypothetical protein [Lentisphaeria bacterium]